MKRTNRRMILARRPCGVPDDQDVILQNSDVEALGAGQVLVRNRFLSIDPAIRDWMSEGPSYLPPIALGDVVRSTTIGHVVDSRHDQFNEGDLVVGLNGWEDYSVADGDGLALIDNQEDYPEQYYLSVFGAVGLTAYFSLLEVGLPKAGETLLVSAAAGAVGSLVGQIGKIKGCRVVGIAGSNDKCRWLEELGFDDTLNYREVTDLTTAIRAKCPDGVDIYFDNVGGQILDATLLAINDRARIVFCGAISSYNSKEPVPGPYNLWQILAHSARFEGVLVSNYLDRFPEGREQMKRWLASGKIRFREQIVDGLDHCLDAFQSLFNGTNTGKVVVRVDQ